MPGISNAYDQTFRCSRRCCCDLSGGHAHRAVSRCQTRPKKQAAMRYRKLLGCIDSRPETHQHRALARYWRHYRSQSSPFIFVYHRYVHMNYYVNMRILAAVMFQLALPRDNDYTNVNFKYTCAYNILSRASVLQTGASRNLPWVRSAVLPFSI